MTTLSNGFTHAVFGGREAALETVLRRSLGPAGHPTIQIDDNAARLLQLITGLHAPHRVLEIGTLFGWSTIHLARGLPPGGRVTTVEVDAAAARTARENLEIAGVAELVDVVEADAVEYLPTLAKDSFDMVFIDADKKAYPEYLKLTFPLLRVGGLLVADDALAVGDFSVDAGADADAARELRAIRTYVRAVGRSPKLFSAFAGTENGFMISQRVA